MRFIHAVATSFALLAADAVFAQEIVTTPLDELILELEAPVESQGPTEAPQIDVMVGVGAELRILDKLTGAVNDLSLQQGETAQLGFLSVGLVECRYPVDNPFGDAFAYLQVQDSKENIDLFLGWMLASAPALNAMDHPRYDVWALRCITS
ncbi:MAG: hypothetical protein ACJAVT_002780 [Yoonia sp.]|jgi:hypothetical protein